MSASENLIDANWVKQHAHTLGFALVGITSPDPPPNIATYHDWIESGGHAEMAYLARPDAIQKRRDPQELFPGCQSIIVTGTFYLAKGIDEDGDFQIARYALGEDYHLVLVDRLKELACAIEKQAGRSIEYRVYTDTGPILERDLAQRAGLGWIGKNTCLINPQRGSYFLLAELMLDLALDPDPPYPYDRCGSCTRCIDACPTNCILPNRTIDAVRCISYLTIEKKGTIPEDQRGEIGNWLFGCDICQQVCPWNIRFADQESDPAFLPRPFLLQANLKDFLSLSPGEWRQDFKGSPLERPRRKGLIRNAAVVAGNRSSHEDLDALARVLQHDPDPIPRIHAAWALKQLDNPRAIEVLQQQMHTERDPNVRQALTD